MVAALGGSVEGGAARTGAYRRETLAARFGDMALPDVLIAAHGVRAARRLLGAALPTPACQLGVGGMDRSRNSRESDRPHRR